MAQPKYFRYFPNVKYATSINKAGVPKFIDIKDYFNLVTPRDDIFREETIYETYTVKEGQRPDQISYELYGDEQFYWVILQINEITDYWSQWPLTEPELMEYVISKYGDKGGGIHSYETVETFNNETPPQLVLPGGLTVSENFVFRYPSTPGSDVVLSSTPVKVSNLSYERRLNEKKREIFVLQKKYIYDYDNEVRLYGRNVKPKESFIDTGDFFNY